LQAILNAWALTLPGCVLMLFAWYDGWNNSFHKGYEQFAIGPLVSWLGILIFVASLFYVPMALTRQAVTGNWRAFWQWRVVWSLVRHSWGQTAACALLAFLLNLPLAALKVWPYFLSEATGQAEALPAPPAELSPADALALLNRHYWWAGLYCFGALAVLRLAWARAYAGAVRRAVRAGTLGEVDLAEPEWRALRDLGLFAAAPAIPHPRWFRLARWLSTRLGRLVCGSTVLLAWLGLVFQQYVAEFLRYTGWVGWLNQPLVQLPWFRHLPPALASQGAEIATAVPLLLFAALAWHRFRRPRRHPAPR
jgi:hypothetical protein